MSLLLEISKQVFPRTSDNQKITNINSGSGGITANGNLISGNIVSGFSASAVQDSGVSVNNVPNQAVSTTSSPTFANVSFGDNTSLTGSSSITLNSYGLLNFNVITGTNFNTPYLGINSDFYFNKTAQSNIYTSSKAYPINFYVSDLRIGNIKFIDNTGYITNTNIVDSTNTVRATQLGTTTADVSTKLAAAPSAGQVLTATSALTANWQTPAVTSTTYYGAAFGYTTFFTTAAITTVTYDNSVVTNMTYSANAFTIGSTGNYKISVAMFNLSGIMAGFGLQLSINNSFSVPQAASAFITNTSSTIIFESIVALNINDIVSIKALNSSAPAGISSNAQANYTTRYFILTKI